MQDIFNEQLVKKSSSTKDNILRGLMIIGGLILTFLAITLLSAIGPLLIVVIWFLVWLGMSFLNVEYEYAFTNGELDIDCIYSKSRRKRVFSCNIKDTEIFCKLNDKDNLDKFNNVKSTKNFSSGINDNNTYMFLITYKGESTKVIFEPNEKLLKSIKKFLSPRVMKVWI